MDGRIFDRLTIALGQRAGRRRAVGAALAGVAGLAGLPALTPGASADLPPIVCSRPGARCRRPTQCCSLTCENGRCAGSDIGEACLKDDGCLAGYCYIVANYRGYCSCVTRNRRCTGGKECCSGTCSTVKRCGCSRVGQACTMSLHCCGTDICVDGWCAAAP
ncbi:MAG: hypothetical protein ACKOWF_08995 [Chloroflexota bacterium]